MNDQATPAVDVRDVSVELGGVRVLDGVDLRAEPGEWISVIGPNGAGKSTLLRAVAGSVRMTGVSTLFGTPVTRLRRRDRARLVATVAQSPVVPEGMTVFGYALLGRNPYIAPFGRESAHDLATVHRLLERMDLLGYAHRPLTTLSGGELQRVFLVRALAQEPRLLLLDEPTSALDIGHQQEVMDLVDQLRRHDGLTVLATMHDLSLAGAYADRMVLLVDGRVVARGRPRDVLTQELLSTHYRARVRVLDTEDGQVVVPLRSG